MSDATFEQAIALALKLSAVEQAKLLEQVAAHLAHLIDPPSDVTELTESKTWGAQMLDLLDQLDMSEWETADIPDPVAWLKDQRQQSWESIQARWNIEE